MHAAHSLYQDVRLVKISNRYKAPSGISFLIFITQNFMIEPNEICVIGDKNHCSDNHSKPILELCDSPDVCQNLKQCKNDLTVLLHNPISLSFSMSLPDGGSSFKPDNDRIHSNKTNFFCTIGNISAPCKMYLSVLWLCFLFVPLRNVSRVFF